MVAAINPVKGWIRAHFMKDSPVFWANFRRTGAWISQVIPIKNQPCVIISLPRSGSSWVGSVLSLAASSAYLREPLTQSYMFQYGTQSRSFFEFDPMDIPHAYLEAAYFSYHGIPRFSSNIVVDPSQWSLSKRVDSHLIIKDVNPFLMEWLIQDFNPRIIYLLRHPAAVANSFYKKGWLGEQFRSRLLERTIVEYSLDIRPPGTFWSDFGKLQAIVLNRSLASLRDYADHTVVLYEDLCTNPLQEFERLFRFCGLTLDDGLRGDILSYSNPAAGTIDPSQDTYRNSLEMVNKWREEVPPDLQCQVKEGYLEFDPLYYGSSHW